jgi:EAL domain-containing protein (putative c-di-GMP-specific phosphodiesterase class I)
MHREAVAQLEMETELRRAIERDELSAAWQPLVRLSDGTVTGFEVLLRWNHAQMGAVPPTRFVAVAEETGLIGPLGDWVLEDVCRTACGWRDRGILPSDIRLHINLSPRQLQQPGIVDGIRESLSRYALPGDLFGLEITETAVMADPHSSAIKLRALKDLGLSLSVDDFGTGYSSLGYLQRFPIDALKIDRSFIGGMGDGDKNTEIVRAVAALGRELHMNVVAEGVETAAQAGMLEALGCDLAQGYYFARPMPRHRATALLARRARADVRANRSAHPADEALAVR